MRREGKREKHMRTHSLPPSFVRSSATHTAANIFTHAREPPRPRRRRRSRPAAPPRVSFPPPSLPSPSPSPLRRRLSLRCCSFSTCSLAAAVLCCRRPAGLCGAARMRSRFSTFPPGLPRLWALAGMVSPGSLTHFPGRYA